MLSFDVRRYRSVVRYVGVAHVVFGACLLVIDLSEGMPRFWVLLFSG